MQIQISWLLQKSTDLDLHCFKGRVYPDSAGQGLILICETKTKKKKHSKCLVKLLPSLLSINDIHWNVETYASAEYCLIKLNIRTH